MTKHRPPTHHDHSDVEAVKKRREAAPVFIEEEITGQYVGEDLRRERAKRGTAARLVRLEDKHDQLVEKVSQTREIVGQVAVKVDTLVDRDKAQTADEADKTKHRRARITAVIAALGATAGALGHWIASHL